MKYALSVILMLLFTSSLLAQSIIWNSCDLFNKKYARGYILSTTISDTQVTPKCGTISYRLDYSNPKSQEKVDGTIKAYIPISPSLGSVILIGDSYVGVSGDGIEEAGYKLFKALDRKYSVYMPSIRGTNSYQNTTTNPFECNSGSFNNLDHMATKINYTCISQHINVDNMARDLILISNQVRELQTSGNITLYGRSFGSYIINRALLFNSTICNSVILESAWGPHTNAAYWDRNRRSSSEAILKLFDANMLPEYKARTTRSSLEIYTDFALDEGIIFCGTTVPSFVLPLEEVLMISVLQDTARPNFFSLLSFIDKCDYFGYGSVLSYFPYFEASRYEQYNSLVLDVESFTTATNVILSELINNETMISELEKNKILRTGTNYISRNLYLNGWNITRMDPCLFYKAI
ncbi:hypothetical protein AKO1_008891 [Acrasis kona]|uniref:Uncharacterized protein n=1 Tax=Acrasis kona TaxID=1008807 RepID=A0AAW2ZG67_9EUKA